MSTDLASRVLHSILGAWKERDPAVEVRTREQADGLLDLTVVSALFGGMAAPERESLLWSVLMNLPPEDALRMTYSLLLSPDESDQFAAVREEID